MQRPTSLLTNECLRIISLFSVSLFLSQNLYAQSDCTLRKNQDSIKVYTCNTDTSKFKSIKAEANVNTSLDKLEKFLLDFPNYKNWQFNTIESRSLKKIADTEFIYYTQIEAPWPVNDRDMVVRFILVRSNKQLIVTANSESNILENKKDIVRVPASRSKWTITEVSENRVSIKYEIQIDPGGNIPAWLVNWMCANAPYQSFKKLRELLEKK
ncbi:MAG: START domain-containing protein [Cyclobacteriaceae bacterium]